MSMASMEKHLFNLKFASKELERCSKKSDKEEKAEKLKLKKAIEKGNHEVGSLVLVRAQSDGSSRLPGYTRRTPSDRRTSPSTT